MLGRRSLGWQARVLHWDEHGQDSVVVSRRIRAHDPLVHWNASGRRRFGCKIIILFVLADGRVLTILTSLYPKQGGLNLKVEDIREHPYNLWGQAKRTVAGWNLSARVNTYSQSISTLAVDLLAENGDTALQVEGTADTNLRRGAVNKLSLAQKLLGGALTMVPSYNLQTNQADISLTYAGLADTVVSVEASTGAPQVISISQRVGDAARLIPSVSSDGEVEIEYRQMIKDGMVAAVYKPNNAVTLKWFDGPWVATIDAPMTGPQTFTNELKVSIKRDVQVF